MSRCILIVFLAVLAISVGFASVSVSVETPASVVSNSDIPVIITISTDENLIGFDVSGFLPTESSMTGWTVDGYEKSQIMAETYVHDYMGKTYNMNHWKFGAVNPGTIRLIYSFPAGSSDKEIISLWFWPSGFNTQTNTIRVAQPSQNSPITGYVIQQNNNELQNQEQSEIQQQIISTSNIFSSLGNLFSQAFY